MSRPIRILVVSSHPVHQAMPVYRHFESDPRVELTVAYCYMGTAGSDFNKEFGVDIQWDIPMLEGYRHIALKNRSPRPGHSTMFGMINTDVWSLIRSGNYDVVVSSGYRSLTAWIALAAARSKKVKFAWISDAFRFTTHETPGWWRTLKGFVLPRIYGAADMIFCMSSRGVDFFTSLHMHRPSIHLVPYVVDNAFFAARAASADRDAVRAAWGVGPDDLVALCCGKLAPWKRPQDLIEAIARVPGTVAAFAGDGELRDALTRRAAALGVSDRVRFLGFVNQTALPGVYLGADVLVMPSSYDAFGLVVNEAMVCGRPTIVSDSVGAEQDLVDRGVTGWVTSVGDVEAIARHLEQLQDPAVLQKMGEAARTRIASWGVPQYVDAVVAACQTALGRRPQ